MDSNRELRTQIAGMKAVFDVHMVHLEKALILRTEELDKRLEQMNKFRRDVERDREDFVRKDMFETRIEGFNRCHESIERNMQIFKDFYQEAHSRLAERVTIIETRLITWAAAIAGIFILAQLALKFIH